MSNEERRERAKSTLSQHLAEQAARVRRRRLLIITGSAAAVVIVVAVALGSVVALHDDSTPSKRATSSR